MIKYYHIFIIISFCFLFLQADDSEIKTDDDYKISSEKFFTDKNGNIKMFVNIWGHVNNPGLHEVYDGIDLATLLSVVGGPRAGAKLNEVRLYRETPDSNGKTVYVIDLESFYNSGKRNSFIKIKPNDTIIMPQKLSSIVLSRVGTLNTFLTMFNIYLQIQRNN